MQLVSQNAEEFQALAADFARTLQSHTDRATVIALSGDLGAGKTMWVQGIAKVLGVTDIVSSPTFVIEKIYDLHNQPFSRLIHIDAYRLKNESELQVLGWGEIVRDPDNLILIEWPERVPGFIPDDAIRIRFDIAGEGRIITIDDGKKEGSKSTNE